VGWKAGPHSEILTEAEVEVFRVHPETRHAPARGYDMRMMFSGLSGWARMKNTTNESLKLIDTAITVVATLMVATTWAILR